MPGTNLRQNQRYRTRKDLLDAAASLLKAGSTPTLEDVAATAKVSRATAYRYFPNIEALIVEVRIDVDMPTPDALFHGGQTTDVKSRLDRVAQVIDTAIRDHEDEMRLMLALSLRRPRQEGEAETPRRQNRRLPLIERALEPARTRMDPVTYRNLCAALAVFMGVEATIVLKDVLRLSDNDAAAIKSWALDTLMKVALSKPRS